MGNIKKNKIALFLYNLEGGGAEKSVSRILKGIDRKIFECSVILKERKGVFLEDIPEDIAVISLKKLPVFFDIFQIINLIKKGNYDIFISFLPRENIISLVAKIFVGNKTKFVISVRTTLSKITDTTNRKKIKKLISSFFLLKLVKLFYPFADRIVCVSKGAADDFYNITGKLLKTSVIYNPFDIDSILKLADEPIEEGLSENSHFNILVVGRLIKAKDYPILLKAMSLVEESSKAKIFILGEGEEKDNLLKTAKELGMGEDVYFLGFKKNPYKYMAKADLFVLSSKREGFPNVLVEAMACGTPVISTDCQSGPNEIIEDGKSGFLVPVGDEKALADAIIKLLENPDLRKRFSEEGKKRAQNFSMERIVKEYEKLFNDLTAK